MSWEVRFECLDAQGESIAEVTEPLTVYAAVQHSAPTIELWVSTVPCACTLSCADLRAIRLSCAPLQ